MRFPKFLKDNGRIGFIAPSFGAATEPYKTCYDSAKRRLREMGYSIVEGPNVYEASGLGKSNTPDKCGAEINDFFLNDRSDVIISCGGGETMCEDLNYVDFEAIAGAEPTWYMGYSDNTNLVYTLPVLADMAAIYAPCASSFGMENWHESIHDAMDVLTGKNLKLHNYEKWEIEQIKDEERPLVPYNTTEEFKMIIDSPDGSGRADLSGRLIGGCLDCLQVLAGTAFDRTKEFAQKYEKDGIIWFLEACDLNPMGIRRALWQLDNCGWFKNVKGFLIGRAMHFDDDFAGMNRINAVIGILKKYNVPIILDLDIGHLPPMMPLIAGAFAEVRAAENSINIDMKLI